MCLESLFISFSGIDVASFNDAVRKTIVKEGGSRYTEIAGDSGGATKYGISQKAYPELDIKNLTEDRAKEIYRRDYWNRVRGDEIESQAIAESIFDAAVNMGVRTASKICQAAIGIEPADGVIGAKSLELINKQEEKSFIALFTLAKISRYAAICNKDRSQSKFLLGWINRSLGA